MQDRYRLNKDSTISQHYDGLATFSKQVRNRLILFLLFEVYALLSVMATTDKMVFLETPIKAPLLNMSLPLIGFYIIVPLFIVALQFNLLYLFKNYKEFLRKTLNKYSSLIDSLPFGLYEGIVFNNRNRNNDPSFFSIYTVLNIFFSLLIYIFPIIVTFLFWFRFADYQDFYISSWHLLLLIISIGISWYFHSLTKFNDNNRKVWNILNILKTTFIFLFISIFIIYHFLVIREFSRNHLDLMKEYNLTETIDSMRLSRFKSIFIPILKIEGDVLIPMEKNKLELLKELKGSKEATILSSPLINRSYKNFNFANFRNSILVRTVFYKANLLYGNFVEVNLANSSFEEANLTNANLERANLTNANLERANLTNANLERANLTNANLERANLTNANLERANLTNANLMEANLTNANLMEANLTNANLMEVNLTSVILMGSNLINTDLSGTNLTNANLIEANLINANLVEANLEHTNLYRVNLENSNLYKANLKSAYLLEANLKNAYLVEANLTKANLRNAYLLGADLTNANLKEANLVKANLLKVDLTDANLRGANLIKANLSGANITGVNLAEANLIKTDLAYTNLVNVDLLKANITDVNLKEANLTDIDLKEANLTDVNLVEANLTNIDFKKANFRSVDLSKANITDVDLSEANFADANLSEANLRNVDFRGADLTGADFKGTILKNVNFEGAILKGTVLEKKTLPKINSKTFDSSNNSLLKRNLTDTDNDLLKIDQEDENKTTQKYKVKEFIDRYFSLEESVAPPEEFIPFFEYPIKNFFGKKNISKKELIKNRVKYNRDWPERDYKIDKIVIKQKSQNSFSVKVSFSYKLKNGRRKTSGYAKQYFLISYYNSKFKIKSMFSR